MITKWWLLLTMVVINLLIIAHIYNMFDSYIRYGKNYLKWKGWKYALDAL